MDSKALYLALRSAGIHRINSPIVFCDSDYKLRLCTEVADTILGGIRLGSSIKAFIPEEIFERISPEGSLFPSAASFSGSCYSVIIYKKRIVEEDMLVILLLGADLLMYESYPSERLAVPYQRLIFHISERLDELLSGEIKRPNGSFANDMEQFVRTRNVVELYDRTKHLHIRKEAIKLDAFFNQLSADGKYSLLHSIIRLDLSQMKSRSLHVEASFGNMFFYFTLIMLNLLTISLNDTVVIRVTEINNSEVKAELSTELRTKIFKSDSVINTRPEHRMSLDELSLELFRSNVPFALDVAVLEEFLRDTGWTAYAMLSKEQFSITTNIKNVFTKTSVFLKNAEPCINIFWICLNAFEEFNPAIKELGSLRDHYPIFDDESEYEFDEDEYIAEKRAYADFEQRLSDAEADDISENADISEK